MYLSTSFNSVSLFDTRLGKAFNSSRWGSHISAVQYKCHSRLAHSDRCNSPNSIDQRFSAKKLIDNTRKVEILGVLKMSSHSSSIYYFDIWFSRNRIRFWLETPNLRILLSIDIKVPNGSKLPRRIIRRISQQFWWKLSVHNFSLRINWCSFLDSFVGETSTLLSLSSKREKFFWLTRDFFFLDNRRLPPRK